MRREQAGIAILTATIIIMLAAVSSPRAERLPREVWIASVTLMSEFGDPNDPVGTTVGERIDRMLERMEEAAAYEPDIVCLSEVFAHTGLEGLPPVAEYAETLPGPVVKPFRDFARKHHCYVICPMYTKRDGRVYNAAVLIDRQGDIVGEYDKIHPTEGELEKGITPGPVNPPVFETDFGTIGMMICFDANWPGTWKKLKEKGAEIVFWPSAFAGGDIINTLALMNGFYIVSCTRYQPARIVDITGRDVFSNGRLQSWFCAPVNLDRKVFHWDFQDDAFKRIQARYGDRLGYDIAHPEGWFILESRSPDVRLNDVIGEYGLVTYDEYIGRATRAQDAARP